MQLRSGKIVYPLYIVRQNAIRTYFYNMYARQEGIFQRMVNEFLVNK